MTDSDRIRFVNNNILNSGKIRTIIESTRKEKNYMFDVMNYADRNDVEVSIRKGHDGRTVWEIFLRDHKLSLTEFTRIIDIEIRGRLDQDAYIELRCEEMMDRIRSARMKNEYADIEMKKNETAGQPVAAGSIFLPCHIPSGAFVRMCPLYCFFPEKETHHSSP